MARIFLSITLFFILLTNCMNQKMMLAPKNITDSKLCFDGYYKLRGKAMFYDSVKNSTAYGVAKELDSYNVYIFYSNGVFIGGETLRADSVNNRAAYLYERYKNSGKSKRDANLWGIFTMVGDSIKIENWEPSSGGGMKTVIRMGKVLNDTTFVITEKLNHYDNEKQLLQDTFNFSKLSRKPDSTNIFIK